ncbi:MAG: ABC transporter permease subunit [Selenomonadaceae bacterium]|nr:ABC transporter permease subunit [Selenomonadaceae bacterium]
MKKIFLTLVAVIFFTGVFAPLGSLFMRITPDGFAQMISSPQFSFALWNSISTGLIATVIALTLGLTAAWCLERTTIGGKKFFAVVFGVPMLIPSISHSFGLVALFGANGWLTNLFALDVNIYGASGIVAGSVMYAFPVAFFIFLSVLHCEDGSPYLAAEVLGVPRSRQFLDLTLPYLKRTIIATFFATFSMIVTDYGVPLMIGGKTLTLSVLMYNKAVGMMDYSSGSVLGAVLIVPALIAFLADVLNPPHKLNDFAQNFSPLKKNSRAEKISLVFCVGLSVLIVAPIVTFCVMTFATKYPVDMSFTLYNITRTIHRGALDNWLNSLVIAITSAVVGTIFSFALAYFSTRAQGSAAKVVHLLSILPMTIPGIALGLGYVIFFHDAPIYGTLIILTAVNVMHFFSSPYLMMRNTLEKISANVEAVGKVLGVPRRFIIRDMILPKVRFTLCEMFAYFFVNAMMTISAVSYLAPPAPKPLALMITQFEAQRLMESAAAVSIVILLTNLLLKIFLTLFENKNT